MPLLAPQPGQVPKEFDPEFLRIPSTNASLVFEEDVGEGEEEEVPEYIEDLREEVTMDLTTEEAISPSQVTVLTQFFFSFFQCITNMRIYSVIVLP